MSRTRKVFPWVAAFTTVGILVLIGLGMNWPVLGMQNWITVTIALAVFTLTIVGGYVAGWKWTGFGEEESEAGSSSEPNKKDTKRTKKLWDWLELLIIPAVLAIGGILFSFAQADHQLAIEEQRAQDTALQSYLDQMSELLLGNDDQRGLNDPEVSTEVRTLARARTLTILERLDQHYPKAPGANARKGAVMRFLQETTLISADLPGDADEDARRLPPGQEKRSELRAFCESTHAEDGSKKAIMNLRTFCNSPWLQDAPNKVRFVISLKGAELRGIYLRNADLWGTSFFQADLRNANLRNANLVGSTMLGADLTGAELRGASLVGADLGATDLSAVDLRRADLSYADLTTAYNLTQEELNKARGNSCTKLPKYPKLKMPREWHKPPMPSGCP